MRVGSIWWLCLCVALLGASVGVLGAPESAPPEATFTNTALSEWVDKNQCYYTQQEHHITDDCYKILCCQDQTLQYCAESSVDGPCDSSDQATKFCFWCAGTVAPPHSSTYDSKHVPIPHTESLALIKDDGACAFSGRYTFDPCNESRAEAVCCKDATANDCSPWLESRPCPYERPAAFCKSCFYEQSVAKKEREDAARRRLDLYAIVMSAASIVISLAAAGGPHVIAYLRKAKKDKIDTDGKDVQRPSYQV